MQCTHGEMKLRTGEKNGKKWSGYFCPLPQERKDEQCPPQWNKTNGGQKSGGGFTQQDREKINRILELLEKKDNSEPF